MSELFGHIIYHINSYQRILNTEIASSFRQIDESGLYGSLIIIAIAFIYGVIHAVGPGHGKALVGTYFLSHKEKISSAFKIGYMVAIIHAISAFILTFVIYYMIEGIFSKTFNQSVEVMYKISGILIIFVGFYLIYELKKEWNKTDTINTNRLKKPYVLALSVGIVPCPGVMTILLFFFNSRSYHNRYLCNLSYEYRNGANHIVKRYRSGKKLSSSRDESKSI